MVPMVRRSKVAREIQQRVPFGSVAQEAVIALWRTADVMRDRIARVVEPSGVTLQQYNVLRILRGAEPEGLQTLAIGERMIERAPGITRMIDRLERKGLVTRARRTDDRRCVVCRITERGLALLATLDAPLRVADDSALGDLSAAEQLRLVRLLDKARGTG